MAPPEFVAALQKVMAQAALEAGSGGQASGGDRRTGRGSTGLSGVTLHKRTQRYEGHVWCDKKQIYLGAYDVPEMAAAAHDMMSLRSKPEVRPEDLNFSPSRYQELLPALQRMPQAELVTALRAFSKSAEARAAAAAAGVSRPLGASQASSRRGGSVDTSKRSMSTDGWAGGRGAHSSLGAPGGGGGSGSFAAAGLGDGATSRMQLQRASSLQRAHSAGLPPLPVGPMQRAASAGLPPLAPLFGPHDRPSSRARGSNKRKAPTPTQSVTDLDSLERHFLQQAAGQEQLRASRAAELAAGASSLSRAGSTDRPRRLNVRQSWAGEEAAWEAGRPADSAAQAAAEALAAALAAVTAHTSPPHAATPTAAYQQPQPYGLPPMAPAAPAVQTPHLFGLGQPQVPGSPLKIQPLHGLPGWAMLPGAPGMPAQHASLHSFPAPAAARFGSEGGAGGSAFLPLPIASPAGFAAATPPQPPPPAPPLPALATPPPRLWPFENSPTSHGSTGGGGETAFAAAHASHPGSAAAFPASAASPMQFEAQQDVLMGLPVSEASPHPGAGLLGGGQAAQPAAGLPNSAFAVHGSSDVRWAEAAAAAAAVMAAGQGQQAASPGGGPLAAASALPGQAQGQAPADVPLPHAGACCGFQGGQGAGQH